jgi:hypothetical protein
VLRRGDGSNRRGKVECMMASGRGRRVANGTRSLTILALGLNLDQHLLLSHDLDNLSNITSRFIQE